MDHKQDPIALIQAWIEGEKKALEWSVGSRTFQISGIRGAEGLFERHFHGASHPTRSRVEAPEIMDAINKATTVIWSYRGEKGGVDTITFPDANAVLATAKAWLGR